MRCTRRCQTIHKHSSSSVLDLLTVSTWASLFSVSFFAADRWNTLPVAARSTA